MDPLTPLSTNKTTHTISDTASKSNVLLYILESPITMVCLDLDHVLEILCFWDLTILDYAFVIYISGCLFCLSLSFDCRCLTMLHGVCVICPEYWFDLIYRIPLSVCLISFNLEYCFYFFLSFLFELRHVLELNVIFAFLFLWATNFQVWAPYFVTFRGPHAYRIIRPYFTHWVQAHFH